jgi:predicted permease
MKLLDSIRFRIAALFQRSQMNAELEEELRSHIQHRADDLERSCFPRAEAERRARVEFGGYERYRQDSYEAAGNHFFERLLQDVRYGLRVLGKSPGFTVTAVVTLALAIGANAVVFSMLNALVLRPLNVLQAQSLYTVERGGKDHHAEQSYLNYKDLRDRNRSFDGMFVYTIAPVGLDTDGNPVKAWLFETSGNYFDVLGIHPYLGRFFHASDEHGPDSAPYIVLSYDYWRSHFHGDTGVVGRTVQLNKYPYTILGVAPQRFRGTVLVFAPEMWVPMVNEAQIDGSTNLNARGNDGLFLEGRLKAGVTPAQATGDLNAIGASLAKTYPKEDDQISFCLTRPGLMGDMLGGPVHAFLGGLMLLAGLILLAACANLGSLFAARAADRSREVALRLALGSSRQRILRQLLTEAVMVALMGGALGIAGGVVLLRVLSTWHPLSNIPITVPVHPDARTYVVAVLLAVASGVLFGLVPVRQVLRVNPYEIVKAGSASVSGRRLTVRDLLLVVQIAICAVLVTSSLVALRGLARSMHTNFGFEPQNALLVITDLDMARYSGDQVVVMQRRMLDAVKDLPGVSTAAYSDVVPLQPYMEFSPVFRDSTTDLRSSNAVADAVSYGVSPEYFRAAGTAVLTGRTIAWDDKKDSPPVAVVNEEFGRKMFGSVAKAVGSYFKANSGQRIRVVGVVEDGKYMTLTEDPRLAMFRPILQAPSSATFLEMRTSHDPGQVAAAVERTLHTLDPGLPLTITTWTKELNGALFASRVATISLGVLGVLGAMLAVTGIFGMAAYSVSKRLRELGIRIALGAQRGEVLQAALGRTCKLLAFGSAAGLLLGLLATKVLAFIVYQATPRDPLILAGVGLAMSMLGLVATWLPAQRALSVDPVRLLREE